MTEQVPEPEPLPEFDDELDAELDNVYHALDKVQANIRQITFDEPTRTTKIHANLTCDKLNGKPINEYSTNGHTHSMADITDYDDTLILQDISTMKDNIVDIYANKADNVHTHNIIDITDGVAANGIHYFNENSIIINKNVSGRFICSPAATDADIRNHTHTIAQVDELQTTLDYKADTEHTHTSKDTIDEDIDDEMNTTLTLNVLDVGVYEIIPKETKPNMKLIECYLMKELYTTSDMSGKDKFLVITISYINAEHVNVIIDYDVSLSDDATIGKQHFEQELPIADKYTITVNLAEDTNKYIYTNNDKLGYYERNTATVASFRSKNIYEIYETKRNVSRKADKNHTHTEFDALTIKGANAFDDWSGGIRVIFDEGKTDYSGVAVKYIWDTSMITLDLRDDGYTDGLNAEISSTGYKYPDYPAALLPIYVRQRNHEDEQVNTITLMDKNGNQTFNTITAANVDVDNKEQIANKAEKNHTHTSFNNNITLGSLSHSSGIELKIASNDEAARIRHDGRNLEIAVGDDGNEEIKIQQWYGSSHGSFTRLDAEAKLLDKNHNTSFPGTLTASNVDANNKEQIANKADKNHTHTEFNNDITVNGIINAGAIKAPIGMKKPTIVATSTLNIIYENGARKITITPSNGNGTDRYLVSGSWRGYLYSNTAGTARSVYTAIEITRVDDNHVSIRCAGDGSTVIQQFDNALTYVVDNPDGWICRYERTSADINTATIVSFTTTTIYDAMYPVGSIYTSMEKTEPNILFPGTKWENIHDRFLWCAPMNEDSGTTSGSKKISAANLPAHTHGFASLIPPNNNTGNPDGARDSAESSDTSRSYWRGWNKSGAFYGGNAPYETRTTTSTGDGTDYMPPYYTVYAWKRTG